ncbi:DUF4350 domain-containing protein [Nocardioides daphniae]|uniref:DUF4350 domain-containing protein n=1 Tax=Nocardioides daphniae TaxID=402297 RepID=A0A4P7UH75_9ACTN|nr:DUF4350 domain-containing protein [Nocardioides daphniae]QCC78019.1 DUF4350 domain-containing protein [Nocardioides daphniae]GGD23020.1 hypothetical protein GCM10007231_22620 [Nocardioides daphniae]
MRPRGTRAGWLIGAVVVLTVLAAALLRQGDARTTAPLDPHNPSPDGAQAVARVLAAEGVEVVVIRGRDALDAVAVGSSTTVVVTSSDQLGPSTVTHLREHAADGRVVVAAPPPTVAALLTDRDPIRTELPRPVAARCDDPRLSGLHLQVDDAYAYPGDGCFEVDDGALVADVDGVRLLGAAELLSNARVTTSGNAAVALALLGATDQLVWYVPDLRDLDPSEVGGLAEALPPWLGPALWLVALSGTALVLWRARRLGPLAVEPLPVPVRAIESTVGRGRLQQRAGDRTHAASVLRTATRRRIGQHLQVPPDEVTLLCAETSRRLARPVPEVETLLSPDSPAPTSDSALVRLAQELAALTEEVRTR